MNTASTSHFICSHCHSEHRFASSELESNHSKLPLCKQCEQPFYNGEPLTLNDQNFAEVIAKTELPIIVDFWSIGCGPCKAMLPAYKEASQALFPEVILAKVNIETSPQITEKYDVRGLPTFIVFKEVQSADRKVGAMPAEQIIKWIKSVI